MKNLKTLPDGVNPMTKGSLGARMIYSPFGLRRYYTIVFVLRRAGWPRHLGL